MNHVAMLAQQCGSASHLVIDSSALYTMPPKLNDAKTDQRAKKGCGTQMQVQASR